MLTYSQAASQCKAIADETRLQIIDMLSCKELCACNILEAFAITQPTLSYHMKILTDCGLVSGRKDGAWMRYTLNRPAFDALQDFLVSVSASKDACICEVQAG
jgi:ArsR family transcriptional regulator, arsenate/arsenite/antimonite-responsive transcriptional repressor